MGAVVAVALATMGAPSHAATNIAALQNISFAFTDLNPGDGIDPELIESPGSVESGFGVLLDGYFPGSAAAGRRRLARGDCHRKVSPAATALCIGANERADPEVGFLLTAKCLIRQ